jgi:hypothetical protein
MCISADSFSLRLSVSPGRLLALVDIRYINSCRNNFSFAVVAHISHKGTKIRLDKEIGFGPMTGDAARYQTSFPAFPAGKGLIRR